MASKKLRFLIFSVDRCPVYFNDGEDPWNIEENHVKVFTFDGLSAAHLSKKSILPTSLLILATIATYSGSIIVL
jgi:hypothetical protein